MQLNGIGMEHSSDMHSVTKCLHDHSDAERNGGAKMLSAPGSTAQFSMRTSQEQQKEFSFAELAQRLLASGRERLLGFWRGNDIPSVGETGEKTGTAQVMAQMEKENDTSVANAARHNAMINNNPYFAAVTPERPQSTGIPVLQKVKLKTKAVTGQLAKHLPGKFFNFQKQGSFHAKKEGSRENIRRRSKYRQDELEIDCVLTDESFLLDSYDRKGEYSQLTTRK